MPSTLDIDVDGTKAAFATEHDEAKAYARRRAELPARLLSPMMLS